MLLSFQCSGERLPHNIPISIISPDGRVVLFIFGVTPIITKLIARTITVNIHDEIGKISVGSSNWLLVDQIHQFDCLFDELFIMGIQTRSLGKSIEAPELDLSRENYEERVEWSRAPRINIEWGKPGRSTVGRNLAQDTLLVNSIVFSLQYLPVTCRGIASEKISIWGEMLSIQDDELVTCIANRRFDKLELQASESLASNRHYINSH